MVQGWVTTLVLAFGILVAVIGVIAYLRMFRKDRLSRAYQSTTDVPPPHPTIVGNTRENGQDSKAKSEQAAPRD
ncbi:hypothetical protein L1N85_10355 [Paenibacillus alkaliterrae]|uniref:hypothetical protein n=1 Tax=Paenibacillus alkaliterrae TaxID=320909 RepID=UPI001F359864|nr:hypothetical protein [Paenibacillus alkaliterrae]MCF2938837.1 hypothetical protein [Paenibacillus alkaliterrae]